MADLCDAVVSQNAYPGTYTVVEWCEAAERECARAPLLGHPLILDKLNWSQICELITVLDPLERSFCKKECVD